MSLIRRVQAEDAEAWQWLVQVYSPLIYRWIRGAGLPVHDAADVVQNIFVSLMRKMDRFSADHPNASFRGWLWTVTRNAVHEYRRREMHQPVAAGGSKAQQFLQQQQQPNEDMSDEIPDQAAANLVLLHRSLTLIQTRVDATTWQAFSRSAMGGEPAADIAADLGMTPHTVRQAKYRILCRLRELMADR